MSHMTSGNGTYNFVSMKLNARGNRCVLSKTGVI